MDGAIMENFGLAMGVAILFMLQSDLYAVDGVGYACHGGFTS